MNMVYAFGFDCTDVFDLTKAEIAGRQQALWAVTHYATMFRALKMYGYAILVPRWGRVNHGLLREIRIADDYVLNQGRCSDSVDFPGIY